MAFDATNARRENWKRLFVEYQNLNQRLIEAPAKEHDALERGIVALEEDLLDSPAPSYSAVLWKIEAIFGELLGLDAETEAKRLILEDLAGLVAENRLLLGEPA